MSILFIDDSIELLEIFQDLMSEYDIKVDATANLDEAEFLLRHSNYALILIDKSVYTQWKSEGCLDKFLETVKATPIAIITGDICGFMDDVEVCRTFYKPFDFEEIYNFLLEKRGVKNAA